MKISRCLVPLTIGLVAWLQSCASSPDANQSGQLQGKLVLTGSSTTIRQKYSAIEWRAIAGMRDRLIHNYFGVG